MKRILGVWRIRACIWELAARQARHAAAGQRGRFAHPSVSVNRHLHREDRVMFVTSLVDECNESGQEGNVSARHCIQPSVWK